MQSYFLVSLKPWEVPILTGLLTVKIWLIQQGCLVTMYITKKKIRKICFTVGIAHKTFFTLYSVIVNYPGKGNLEKNYCW